MKDIKDYLHLYLGCEGQYYAGYGRHGKQWVKARLVGFTSQGKLILICYDKKGAEWGYDVVAGHDEFKPSLRRLSSITKEEVADLMGVDGFIKRGNWSSPFFQCEYEDLENETHSKHLYLSQMSPEQTVFLLSKGFDLFNLIDEGLAFDAATNK